MSRRYMAETHEIDGPAALGQHISELGEDFTATRFQAPDFLAAFFDNVAVDGTAVMVVIREVDTRRAAMLVPLLLRNVRSVRFVEGVDRGLSDYVAPLVARWFQPTRQEMAQIWSALVAELPPADIVSLKKMPLRLATGVENPLINLPGSVTMGISTKLVELVDDHGATPFRRSGYYKEGQRHLRRLTAATGEVEFRVAANDAEAQRQFDHLLMQRRSRFRELGRDDPLRRPEVERFYRELLATSVDDGNILFGALYADGECIACDLGLLQGDRHHGVLTSMTTGPMRRFSPGTIAHVKMLDETVARGLRFYDLGVGEFAYKDRFQGQENPLFEMHQALTLRGRLALGEAGMRRLARRMVMRHPQLRPAVQRLRDRIRRWRNLPAALPLTLCDTQMLAMAGHAGGFA